MGGIGKTQLAITFVERYHEKYSSVFWLKAKDDTTLRQELVGLATITLEKGQVTATFSADDDSIINEMPKNDR